MPGAFTCDENRAMNRSFGVFAAIVFLCSCVQVFGQIAGRGQADSGLSVDRQSAANAGATDAQAEQELQKGTALTHDGHFTEAIPHLKSARGRVANEYAASFNLALCYVATGMYKEAISVLNELQRDGRDTIDVQNLLAQAYVGSGQSDEAWRAFEHAAAKSPQNERLYVFVADACTDHQDFELGLKIVNLGLQNLPHSARLEYQRGMFLTQLDRFDQAKPDFDLAAKLAPDSEIAYLSKAEESSLEGDIDTAVRTAREGIRKGFQDPVLLTVLGAALLRSGIAPGQPEFSEAQSALEKSVAERPNDAASQIALGEIYLQSGHVDDAIVHLEKARQMKPNQPAVYANLAKAYQRQGDTRQARQALATLEKLNLARADQIRNAPGERKMSYGGQSGDQPPK
jgi:predicted Zn-dependent protease